jgi:hypothetical protein
VLIKTTRRECYDISDMLVEVGGLLFFYKIAGEIIFSKIANLRYDSIIAKRSYSNGLVPNKYFDEDPVADKVYVKKGW